MNLEEFFCNYTSAAIAFSGGTDSSFLLYSAMKYNCNITAYCIVTPFLPLSELTDAVKFADETGAKLKLVECDPLSSPAVTLNYPDRCYHCKSLIFKAISAQAAADGYTCILDGSNASDNPADRPGMAATQLYNVLSPLRICGLTKDDIRLRSRSANLSSWNKPSYSCLATRIPYKTTITTPILHTIEKAESLLFHLGFSDFRVRYQPNNTALLQFTDAQLQRALSLSSVILTLMNTLFPSASIDTTPRAASTLCLHADPTPVISFPE